MWHVPSAETLTTREFLALVYDELGQPLKIRAAGGSLLALLAVLSPSMRRLRKEKAYQFEVPWVSDHTKYESEFGADATPHTEAIVRTVVWYRTRQHEHHSTEQRTHS